MINFKIFYDDGSTYDSSIGHPRDAPRLGVLVIIQDDPDFTWVSQVRSDYYVWDDRGNGHRWWGVDLFGLWEYLFLHPGESIALAGRTIGSVDFGKIWEAAINDPRFGKKATFARGEMRPPDE